MTIFTKPFVLHFTHDFDKKHNFLYIKSINLKDPFEKKFKFKFVT